MSRRRGGLIVAALLAVALGIAIVWGVALASRPPASGAPVAVASPATTPTPVGCHSVNGLPDAICTPGVADPRVTQTNILTTICLSGYTKTVRPSTAYTNALKRRQISEYGYTDTNLADYEEDHLIPLELGGHPTDPKNLWPEPRLGIDGATKKDGIENLLHKQVCAGLIKLVDAQAAIANNWEAVQAQTV